MPTLALTAGLLALVLAIVAIVLATLANRRHMAYRRRGPDGSALSPGEAPSDQISAASAAPAADPSEGTHAVLASLRERLDTVGDLVSELASAVTRLEVAAAEQGPRWDALAERSADVEERGQRLEERLAKRIGVAEELAAGRASAVEAEVEALMRETAALREHVLSADPSALRHVAVVRYDAFADVGGRLSYSLAVLDDTDTGFVVTTLSGKAEVRTYVRTVSEGVGDGTLTAEERQAIEAAREGAGSRP